MQIRTITAGAREADLERVARAAQLARRRLEADGYHVQSMRLALTPVSNTCADFATVTEGAERLALEAGFDYVTIGAVEHRRLPELADALGATSAVFASASIAGPDGALRYDSIHAAAEAMIALSKISPDGLGNMRFAASACVPPGSPFFPASYYNGGEPWIAVGPEAAALAFEAATDQRQPTIAELEERQTHQPAGDDQPAALGLARVTSLIKEHDARIVAALRGFEDEADVPFAGCDWSFAPRAHPQQSIGAAIEALSGVPFGAWGTLAAVRGLTAAVRAAHVRLLGFSGVMLPVLEDLTLARRNDEGRYTLRDLLAFSAVCGTGLDCIPLPGDATPEQIAGVLFEVAALAATLRKPLTARLMPMPGLAAGQQTGFDLAPGSPFAGVICNTRVMEFGASR